VVAISYSRTAGPVIYVTHDPAEARALGDRVLALADSELREASLEGLEE
jgi:ABC-type nitrate/sulfonate/bicarbonate transport system ATPase subunit